MLEGHGIPAIHASMLVLAVILSGFAGVLLGAWLMTRTEQWNLKREHYGRVLRSLADIKAFIGRLQRRESKIGKGHINLLDRSFADYERPAAGSAVILSEKAVEVLEDLEAQWRKVKGTSDGEVLAAEAIAWSVTRTSGSSRPPAAISAFGRRPPSSPGQSSRARAPAVRNDS
jgi:hypothetical protein